MTAPKIAFHAEVDTLLKQLRGDAPDKWHIDLDQLNPTLFQNVMGYVEQQKGYGNEFEHEDDESNLTMLHHCAQIGNAFKENEQVRKAIKDVRSYYMMFMAAEFLRRTDITPQSNQLFADTGAITDFAYLIFKNDDLAWDYNASTDEQRNFVLDMEKLEFFDTHLKETASIQQEGQPIHYMLPNEARFENIDAQDMLDFGKYVFIQNALLGCLQAEAKPETTNMNAIRETFLGGGALSVRKILNAHKQDLALEQMTKNSIETTNTITIGASVDSQPQFRNKM